MPDQPTFYDPTSPNEQAPPLPSAPLQQLTPQTVLQPPLSRRGTGPGLILLLPPNIDPSTRPEKPLDPEPVQKWAEEGFTVVGITGTSDMVPLITDAVDIIKTHENVNIKDKIGIIAYECPKDLSTSQLPPEIVCVAAFTEPTTVHLPTYFHTSTQDYNKTRNVTVSTYPNVKQHFVLPNSSSYDPPSANIAHTRNLVFLKKHIGGPEFDIEAIWEEHTYWEFERRSVAQTMATMVAEPYVNHVPTMTGGMGRKALTKFYRDHFIFCNPPDTALQPISRTVGQDRVVDEFIFSCTHTSHIPWLLPNIPPTNVKLAIPMLGVINVRGDRLYHEHIWWDQGTALRQAGLLPTHLPGPDGRMLRLPVAGVECARLLVDETDGKSNEMIEGEIGY
ncbi:dienelactone hydrolase [Pochonia chlamydosporia 170]|uniref:Dienelactone hydrolase n=1 Tax=Pochonia chlamydosporia 170 TaxID=1380566 RepID=A0A179FIQ8_METCM|nr:dienelactone hydrolase [Pochonia chlamydosporia 170]OAQ65257.1 dienelactone hydrolase [Pochonia chlamydosporia 170]